MVSPELNVALDTGFTPTTPEVYGHYFRSNGQPFFLGNGAKASGNLLRYFNQVDYALGWYVTNNRGKPDTWYDFHETGTGPVNYDPEAGDMFYHGISYLTGTPLRFSSNDQQSPTWPWTQITDTYEIFAYCAESRAVALGAAETVGTECAGHVNLHAIPISYNDSHYAHSREFRSNIVAEQDFWQSVCTDLWLLVN